MFVYCWFDLLLVVKVSMPRSHNQPNNERTLERSCCIVSVFIGRKNGRRICKGIDVDYIALM